MIDTTDSTKLTIVALPNGRFGVQSEGNTSTVDEAGDFATLAEAEAWMFSRTQTLDSRANDLGTLIPGGGQGLR